MKYLEIIREGIVYRDRVPSDDGRRTVIAVNPAKAEWDKWFPNGAAGILCKNGKIVIGDGPFLTHQDILSYAKMSSDQEKYPLQLGRSSAFAEIWLFNDDNWENKNPTDAEVRAFCVTKYGESLRQIAEQVKVAVASFMGPVPVKAIPLNEDQEPFFANDGVFIRKTFPRSIIRSLIC